jgi:hypothetical protein
VFTASFLAWEMDVNLSFRVGEDVVRVGWCMCGMCPMISSNGAFLVVAFGQELSVYCARGSSCLQFF